MPRKPKPEPEPNTYVVIDSTVDGVEAGGSIVIEDEDRARRLLWGGHIAQGAPAPVVTGEESTDAPEGA